MFIVTPFLTIQTTYFNESVVFLSANKETIYEKCNTFGLLNHNIGKYGSA